jgi:predicted acetyltransferase
MTTPGGAVSTAGLTMVGVLPTHRRRGILTSLIRRHLDDARAAGQAISALWATEGAIYGRFGYGLASFAGAVSIERDRTQLIGPPLPPYRARLLSEAESIEVLPGLWERVRPSNPGMLSRSRLWWRFRRLDDSDRVRQGNGPLQRVVIEVEGRPEAYALYRQNHRWDSGLLPSGALHVVEAIGATPTGTRLVWRYLFDIDLMQRIEASLLPADHPLQLMLAEPRRLRLSLSDGLWVRIVDVEAALAARAYGCGGSLTFELVDDLCPWNTGRFRLDAGDRRVSRVEGEPDLRLDAAALGAVYLGGISLRRLVDAGRIEARSEDVVERAESLFHSARAPWSPEIF